MPEVEMRTEKAKLHKTLRRWDLALFAACAIIGFDSVAYTTSVGLGQAITWLIITFFIFLIPLGFLMSEVTAAFPAEGGIYAWCRMTFGKLFGEITTFMYWVSNPVWVGGTLTAVTIGVIDVFFTPSHPLGTAASIVVGLVYTWVVIILSVDQPQVRQVDGQPRHRLQGHHHGRDGGPGHRSSWPATASPRASRRRARTRRASPASSRSSASSASSGSASSLPARPARRWSTRRRTSRARSSPEAPSRPPCTSSSCCACCSCSRRRTSPRRRASRPPCRPS